MRKIFIALVLLFTLNCAQAEVLRATVSKDEIPKGFFGTWHVTSKLSETNNPELFNTISVDIWTLGGYGNTLILENVHTGASSSIQVESQKNLDGKTLCKFFYSGRIAKKLGRQDLEIPKGKIKYPREYENSPKRKP